MKTPLTKVQETSEHFNVTLFRLGFRMPYFFICTDRSELINAEESNAALIGE